MLVEKSREEALQAFVKGRKVLVMTQVREDGKPSYVTDPLEDILTKEDTHYLVEVPAVSNPEFEQAFQQISDDGEKRSKREVVLELAEQGMSTSAIAKQLGMKYNTVYFYLHSKEKKTNKEEEESKESQLGNVDRRWCKTCKYRSSRNKGENGNGCDYVVIEGHSRGCNVENCDKYQKGDPVSKKKQPSFYGS